MPNFTKNSHSSQPERFCKYIHRYCNQTRLDGYDYCIRHILDDKTAPFRQCTYVNLPNKKRCTNAAPKTEKNDRRDSTLCPFHAKRAFMRARVSHPKKKSIAEGPVTFLRYLEHYCSDVGHDPSYTRDAGLAEKFETASCEGGLPTSLDQVQASLADEGLVEDKARIDNVDDDLCWVEKSGDYLEHAGVYTHKEVVMIARDKILKLQKLYCDELKVIYRELKEKRRKFLMEMRRANQSTSTDTSSSHPAKVDSKLLGPLTQYHYSDGVSRILRHREQEKRAGVSKIAKPAICTFERNGMRCTQHAIVLTKFCKNHILSDPKQVLFKPCGLGRNCRRPVIPYVEKVACDLHLLAVSSLRVEEETVEPPPSEDLGIETEHFQSMDDIASLGLDAITPGSLFGLDQFGEPGESTDTVHSEDQADLMLCSTLNPPSDILSDSRKSESE